MSREGKLPVFFGLEARGCIVLRISGGVDRGQACEVDRAVGGRSVEAIGVGA